ncbi:MAG TPA: amino acid ABC transporter substrate-binding protein [Acetobacteraceae bacterium]|nr:amino acid ABC transporter substrate-binding protein [Acetobacteraceae bacterium]
MTLRSAIAGLAALAAFWTAPLVPARAQEAPAAITIGHLHASSGAFAAISMPVYYGLKLWVDQTNASGGAFVKAYDKKIPLKLISYDDQSNPATAATLINQLITQDHVNMLVSDSGSVLTAVAVPIAREHKMFLFDPTGTGAPFFTKDNPYIALLADPASTIWPKYAADFLNNEGPRHGLNTVAILYATNDFTGTQAAAFRRFITEAGKLKIVYDQGVPTSTSNYTVLINNIAAKNPDAVIELGYTGNDIAFLRNVQDSGQAFKFLFTVYAGAEPEELLKNVGIDGLKGVFTYVTGAEYPYKVTTGMDLAQYKQAWDKTYARTPGANFGLNAVAGYTVGIVLQETLGNAKSLDQMALHDAVFGLSGKLTTLQGPFKLDDTGAQVGEITPLGQVAPDGKGGMKLVVVYPPDLATGQPVIGK